MDKEKNKKKIYFQRKKQINNEFINKSSIDTIKSFICDYDNNIYIGIKNFYNSFCYYITAIQRLHSSQTLKEHLDEMFKLDNSETHIIKNEAELSKEIFSILKTYNKINMNNFKEISEEIEKYKDDVILPKFSDDMKSGGDPQLMLTRLFLPIIFHYTKPTIFIQILKELNFSKCHFPNTFYHGNEFNILKSDQYSTYNNALKEWYNDTIKYLNDPKNDFNQQTFTSTFKVSTLCLFFSDVYDREKNSSFAGHAVTIVLGNDNIFYVIDDNVNILPFEEYIKLQQTHIHEMEIKDLTDEAIEMLSQINTIQLNVNMRYYRTTITFKKDTETHNKFSNIKILPLNLNGGTRNVQINRKFLYMFMNTTFGKIYSIVIILLMIILIISIISLIYQEYKIKKLKSELNKLKTKNNKYKQMVNPKIYPEIIQDAPSENILNENYKPKLNYSNYVFGFI